MASLEKTLITGAGGMVGSYVDFGTKLGHRDLDITDFKEVERVFDLYKPEAVVHLAAETDVDRCERDPQYAYLVNTIGTWNIALAAKTRGIKMIYISTVYVFDGSKNGPYLETDKPLAANFYGRSKHLGELAVQGLLDDYAILRAGWMIGGGPKKDLKFIAKIISQIKEGKEVKALNDTMGSITYAKDLVEKIKEALTQKESPKMIHAFNDGFCSRYDIAVAVTKDLGSNTTVTGVDSSYFKLDASRSHSDIMNSLHGGTMRPWQEAVADYIKTEWTGK